MKRHWAVDGQFADQNYQELIFTNPAIETFLNGHERFIVVASKGMGKTLLMRLKRDRIQAANPSILLIPHDSPADYVELTGTYDKGIRASMEKENFWEDLWKLAIQTSILLNFPHDRITADQKSFSQQELNRIDLPGDLQASLVAAFSGGFRVRRTPSSILSILLSASTSKLEQLRVGAPKVLYDLLMHHVTSACFVFIDSFDQAIESLLPGNLAAWSAAQVGLMRAAWQISRHNPHVKVYVTIRQEAFASFSGQEVNNIKGSILLPKYSKEDLNALLLKAIAYYEGLQSVEDFVGLRSIHNTYLNQNENVFDYIHRHLINVPRWLAILGSDLSQLQKRDLNNKKARQESVRRVVNDTSAVLAQDYLYKEMKIFFRGLDPTEMAREMFSRVNSTVLSFSNLEYLSKLLTEQFQWNHPFSLFYNLGLLGMVQPRPGSTTPCQVFRKPYEFDWGFNNILPEDRKTPYLLHPALHSLIRSMNPTCRFSGVLLGDGIPWTKKNQDVVKRETLKLFVSYAHEDEDLVKEVVQVLNEQLRREVRPYDIWWDFNSMQAGEPIHDQLIKAVKECDFLILMASPHSLESNFVKLEWEKKLLEPFYSKTKSYHRVLPILLNGTTNEDMPDILQSIYGFPYKSQQDAGNIKKLVEQMLDHPGSR